MKNEGLRMKNERRNQLREFEELRMQGFESFSILDSTFLIELPGRQDGRIFS
jgi:hypothetical protein